MVWYGIVRYSHSSFSIFLNIFNLVVRQQIDNEYRTFSGSDPVFAAFGIAAFLETDRTTAPMSAQNMTVDNETLLRGGKMTAAITPGGDNRSK